MAATNEEKQKLMEEEQPPATKKGDKKDGTRWVGSELATPPTGLAPAV